MYSSDIAIQFILRNSESTKQWVLVGKVQLLNVFNYYSNYYTSENLVVKLKCGTLFFTNYKG